MHGQTDKHAKSGAAAHVAIHDIFERLARTSPDFRGFTLAKLEEMGEVAVVCEVIPAGRKGVPHYHKGGVDVFIALRGDGELLLGDLGADGNSIDNERRIALAPGAVYVVPAGTVHCMSAGAEDFFFVNVAPPDHVGGDRHFLTSFLIS